MDLERIVDTVLSVRSEFEKEVAKFPSLFLEQLKRLKAEAAAAPPGAGGAAEPPPSRKSALARMFQDALVKGVSNYAEAEAFFLRACALASWLLHAAPRPGPHRRNTPPSPPTPPRRRRPAPPRASNRTQQRRGG